MEDLWALAPRDQGANIAATFDSAWEAQMHKKKYGSLFHLSDYFSFSCSNSSTNMIQAISGMGAPPRLWSYVSFCRCLQTYQ